MFNLMPDPPGTINPSKLSAWVVPPPYPGASGTLAPPTPPETPPRATEAVSQDIEAATRPSPVLGRTVPVPRLTRISSDCDLENDPLLKLGAEDKDIRQEFEQSFLDRPGPSSRLARHLSHHGYFRRQMLSQADVLVPPDPDARLGEVVVVDRASASIYDAYLLRVDIAKNVNTFYRQQVC
jgi:poly [ADP-ribose] polymerase 2/3/4